MWVTAAMTYGQDAPPPLAPLPTVPKTSVSDQEGHGKISELAPPDVVASAVAAVAALGNEVVLGRYQVAIERMNPTWKTRAAGRFQGGMKEMEKQLAGVARQMVQQGISMISFKPSGRPRSYEVGIGKKVDIVNGEQVESQVFNKWMVLVPTVTQFRITRQNEKTLVIDSVGFQVAVSDKEQLDWTFIDGANLTINDLRGLFVNLPLDMQFPTVEKHESR